MYIAEHDTGYYEAFPLDETESTLTAILTALALGAVGTLVLATLFGLATSRRLLRPLSQVADAAADIASGGLDTRLEPESDPDLDRLAGSFNDMADAVQDRIEREARFASDVSHELRSPITALTAAVEVLDGRRDDIPERTQQALDVVVDQVRRFDSMVIDLLELARLDAGATDLNIEDVTLIDLTQRVAARYGEPDVPIVAARKAPDEVAIDKVRSSVFSATCWRMLATTAAERCGSNSLRHRPDVPTRCRRRWSGRRPGRTERIFERFAAAALHAIASEPASARPGGRTQRRHGRQRVGAGSCRWRRRFVVELPVRVEPSPATSASMSADGSRAALAALVVIPVVRAACGVPTGDDTLCGDPAGRGPVRARGDVDHHDDHDDHHDDARGPDTTTTASTTTPIRLDPAEVYFLSRGRLQPVVIELPPGFSADQVTDVLERVRRPTSGSTR